MKKMKKLLMFALLAVLVLGVSGTAFARGWCGIPVCGGICVQPRIIYAPPPPPVVEQAPAYRPPVRFEYTPKPIEYVAKPVYAPQPVYVVPKPAPAPAPAPVPVYVAQPVPVAVPVYVAPAPKPAPAPAPVPVYAYPYYYIYR